ncbi:hypothetical protein PVAP13_5NG412800, partial [Panicum virgatum]
MWNCRGIKKKSVSSFLRNLISEHRFHFLGLQETMQQHIEDNVLRKIDPMNNYLWKWTPSNGRSRGILVGVSVERFDVGSFTEGEFMSQMHLWDKQLKVKWNLITVYGAARDERKDTFLSKLVSFCSRNRDPFIIWGDFNLVRFPSEKNKPMVVGRFTNCFNAIISAYELIDIHMTNGKYTWSNNQSDPTLVRLDRFLVSKDWEVYFLETIISRLPREVSDHNPLIL